ncbi:hypothetical protein [Asanoa siamensis]|uniref:Uncharacterized protein n=1 Tax=Asanoa siamensis TaxID=926357 RepID=A0ABQ4CWZ3_9ACTN|nr:hypothetical protein [Asanoa siamensis]GIF75801.1 hypothetical protein Asi02nite_53190 [Asanoa siamensis]
MPTIRIQLDTDRATAKKAMRLHRDGKIHHESREAARDAVHRQGRIPAAEPVFVGVTNGEPKKLLYDVEVHLDTEGHR